MSGLANLAIAQKLGVLLGAGVLSLGAVGAVGIWSQNRLSDQAEVVQTLLQAEVLLHHLDTREAELKVNGYRAAVETDLTDIVGDMPDDLATVTDTLAAIDELALPADLYPSGSVASVSGLSGTGAGIGTNKTIATLRRDGSPRISATSMAAPSTRRSTPRSTPSVPRWPPLSAPRGC